jgi:hypothetical protein
MSGKPTKPPEKESGGSAPTKPNASTASPKAKAASSKAERVAPKDPGASVEKFDAALRHFLNRAVGVLIVSFFVGCVIIICKAPDGLPAPESAGNGLAVMQVIAQAQASRGSDVAELSEADVNAYLAKRTAPRGFLFDDVCRFDGVVVSFQPGSCSVFTRYSILGYPIYLNGRYSAREDFGRPAFDSRGGAIGRLAIAPAFMRIIQYPFFGELWNGFGIEREALNRFRKVEFEKGLVRLEPQR